MQGWRFQGSGTRSWPRALRRNSYDSRFRNSNFLSYPDQYQLRGAYCHQAVSILKSRAAFKLMMMDTFSVGAYHCRFISHLLTLPVSVVMEKEKYLIASNAQAERVLRHKFPQSKGLRDWRPGQSRGMMQAQTGRLWSIWAGPRVLDDGRRGV